MTLFDLPEIRSVLAILRAVDEHPDGLTAAELGEITSLSRRTVDQDLHLLVSKDLISRGTRHFGRPVTFVATFRGHKAAAYVRSLELML